MEKLLAKSTPSIGNKLTKRISHLSDSFVKFSCLKSNMEDTPTMIILLVEDDPGDAELTQQALSESELELDICVVSNGESALAFLHQEGEYSSAPRPHLVILDLNLPGLHGQEILAEIKGDEHLKSIPVVVFSTSSAPEDINKSYELGSECYLQKPSDWEEASAIAQCVRNFWTIMVQPLEPC